MGFENEQGESRSMKMITRLLFDQLIRHLITFNVRMLVCNWLRLCLSWPATTLFKHSQISLHSRRFALKMFSVAWLPACSSSLSWGFLKRKYLWRVLPREVWRRVFPKLLRLSDLDQRLRLLSFILSWIHTCTETGILN